MRSKVDLRGLNAFIERMVSSRLPVRYFIRFCSSLNFAPTMVVRGVRIRCLIPPTAVGVFDMFDQWERREPETLDWIDEMSPEDILLDIGAGFGTESLYAAKRVGGPGRIVCVDADLMMTFLHANNIKINQAHKITLYVLALSNAFDLPGAEYCFPINYNIVTMSVDDFCQAHHFDPTHIKMDVDGDELDLLSGMERTLASTRTKTLLIEVNDNTRELALRKLNRMGFSLQKEVRHGDTSNCILKRTLRLR